MHSRDAGSSTVRLSAGSVDCMHAWWRIGGSLTIEQVRVALIDSAAAATAVWLVVTAAEIVLIVVASLW